ncbi:uracil-DNA glycosylase family protein [Leuconostocaceae bacterium ESL0723]|nr:uracil-DNA glycosylase family protein [Leuconostocaceae bacterium ESL0723]
MSLDSIKKEIMADPANADYTAKGWEPIYTVSPKAKILIVGQAPGKRVQDTGIMWNDASGERLRSWLGVSDDNFYHSGLFAVLPMDFYYPGKASSGDRPPRAGVAQKWHPRLRALMPDIELTILIGAYAQDYYLDLKPSTRLTDTVKNFRDYLPEYVPIVHPSPRNNIWLKRNPWFEDEVVPWLQNRVHELEN